MFPFTPPKIKLHQIYFILELSKLTLSLSDFHVLIPFILFAFLKGIAYTEPWNTHLNENLFNWFKQMEEHFSWIELAQRPCITVKYRPQNEENFSEYVCSHYCKRICVCVCAVKTGWAFCVWISLLTLVFRCRFAKPLLFNLSIYWFTL